MRIIVIDDQEIIVKGIEKLIMVSFPDAELTICRNSEKAIPIIGKINPDIVITDIRMPLVDGVTLCKIIRKNGYEGRIIIISAYDVFEYAKSAISLGVDEYLLKPINKEKFIELLKRIQNEISQREENKAIQHNAVRIARKEFLKNIVQQIVREEDLSDNCRKLDISGYSHYSMALIKANQNALTRTGISQYGDLIAASEYIFNGNQMLSRYKDIIFTNINSNLFALLIMNDSEFDKEEFIRALREIKKKTLLIFCTGVSASRDNCSSLYDLYCQSKTALDSAFKKNESISFYNEIPHENGNQLSTFDLAEQDLEKTHFIHGIMKSLALHDIESCRKLLREYFHKVEKSCKSSEVICEDCYKIYLELLDSLTDYGFNTREILEHKELSFQIMTDCESLDHIKEHIEEFLIAIENYNSKHKNDVTHIVTMAKQLVGNNLKDVSLQFVADKIDINKTYLSNLFKKTTNEKFKDYVKRIKVEEAKKLLKKTSLPIATIADNLGYLDTKYFSRIFNEVVGLKPVDFRNNYNPEQGSF